MLISDELSTFTSKGNVMPHIKLEYSSNIIEKAGLSSLFNQIHKLLENSLPTDIGSCKSRALECSTYMVGMNNPNNAFVHVNLSVLPGRAPATLEKVGKAMIAILKQYFSESLKILELQISLEITELQTSYFKAE